MKKFNFSTQNGVVFALITALFWGFLAVALKVAVGKIDAYTIVWFRFAMAFLTLLIFSLLTDRSKLYIFKKPPLILLIAGCCLGLNYFGFLKGLEFTSPATAQLVIQVGPICLGIAGVVLFKERLTFLQVLGFIIAGIGLYFFYNEQLKLFIHNEDILNRGMLWIFIASFSWLLFAIFQKILIKKHPANSLNMVIYGLPAVVFLFFVDFSNFQGLGFGFWLLMIYLGINTLVAYGCLALAFKYTQAYKVSIIVTLNPLITLILMFILNKLSVSWISIEKFTPLIIVGALLEVGGAVFAIYFSKRVK